MAFLNVVLVEDSPTIRQNLVATLEELAPVQVVAWADDAESALAMLDRDPLPCDLAIVDVFLRGGSGLEVLDTLRRHGRPLRCVVLTNYATAAMRTHCLALGAERVFDKSAEVEALATYCEALANALG
jgi:two-component system, OmpR family, response regulator